MELNKKKIQKIKGDASSRFFYRDKKKKKIIVYAEKEKKKNLLIYDCINKLLIQNRILAPKLYQNYYNKNYIEIEDFGDITIFKKLKYQKIDKIKIFKKIIRLLIKIQDIKQKKIKNFNNKDYKIPIYTKKILFNEVNLFFDWYVSNKLDKKISLMINKKLVKEVNLLLSNIKLKNDTFVHRDFHVSNLMVYKKRIAVIDSQDSLFGNKAYDLASVIDDVRFKKSLKLKNIIYQYYIKKNKKKIDQNLFKNDFDILSVLRNLKIIGIFSRLSIRDNKKRYLKLIPYTWSLIDLRMKSNPIFKDLKKILDEFFPTKLREEI